MHLHSLVRGSFGALLLCGPLLALRAQPASASVEARLARLEQQLARIEARLGESAANSDFAPVTKEFGELKRQLGWDGKSPLTVVKAAGKEQKLSIGGYLQAQGEFGEAPDSRYTGIANRVQLRRMRLTVKGAFQENFEFALQPEFGNNSTGAVTAYRTQLADAFLAWNRYPALNLQIGQFKTAFGYEQLVADTKTPAIERSLPNDLLTVGRQIGVGASGVLLEKTLSYSVGAYNGNGVNNGGNDNDQFMYAGRLAASAWTRGPDKLTVAANGYWSNDTGTFTGHRTGIGLDAQLTLGRADFAAEYLHGISNRLVGTDVTAEGWYLLAGYYLVPKTLQALIRYESYDANLRTAATTSENWVFGANYYIKGDDLRLVFNYTLGDPAGPIAHQGRFGARLQIIF